VASQQQHVVLSPGFVSEEAQEALSLLLASGKGHLAAGTLRKVFGNIISDPWNPKFHRLRMLNAKVPPHELHLLPLLLLSLLPAASDGGLLPGVCNVRAFSFPFT
jgi:hypothetical protein